VLQHSIIEFLIAAYSAVSSLWLVKALIIFSGIMGFFSFFFDIHGIISWLKRKRADKKEFHRSVELLSATPYFFAHIIHLGGEFSMTYSMYVMCDEEGGYYLNPAKEFVSVGFNRGGDRMIVMTTELTSKAGFTIESFSDRSGSYASSYPNLCHLPIPDMKNEWTVHFRKVARGEKTPTPPPDAIL